MDFNGQWINHPPGGPFLSFCKSQFFCEIRILSGTRVGSNYCPWTNQSLKWSRTFLNNWNWCTVMMSYNITIHKHNKKNNRVLTRNTCSNPTQPILTLVAPMLAAWAPAKNGSYVGSPRETLGKSHRGTCDFSTPLPSENPPCFHMKNSEAWEFCWGKHLK